MEFESPSTASEIRSLIKKNKAGLLTDIELDRLIQLLIKLRQEESLAPGISVAAGIVLANLLARKKPKELAA